MDGALTTTTPKISREFERRLVCEDASRRLMKATDLFYLDHSCTPETPAIQTDVSVDLKKS